MAIYEKHQNGNILPFSLRIAISLVGLIAFFYIVYVAQNILLPFVFAMLVAILLNPIVNFLTGKRIHKVIAITVTLVVNLAFMGGLIFFIISQFNNFADDLPQLKMRFDSFLQDFINWLSERFNLSSSKINSWIAREKVESLNNSNVLIGNAAITLSRIFTWILLIPVYIFLLLFYKPLILQFFSKLFPFNIHGMVVEIMSEIKVLVQHYLIGLLIQMAIVAILTATGLSIIGIQSPILFGIITALLNTIPYVGVLTANITFVTIALVTKSPSAALFVFILYALVQFIDNNIVVPKIVGAKVKMNALATILIVIIGGELCGIAGMFLAIPVLAIFKVVCDHIKPLQPLGYLLGDSLPGPGAIFFNNK